MPILYQIAIIFLICLLGEIISLILPFAFPSAIISLLILLLLLQTKLLKIDHIKQKSDFLLSNMAFFFIPAGVKVIELFSLIKSIWWQFLLICCFSTVLVFFVTGEAVKLCLKLQGRRKNA